MITQCDHSLMLIIFYCFLHDVFQRNNKFVLAIDCALLTAPSEPGKPSCTDGWSLHKHSCYLYYDRQLDTDWHRAAAYCRNLSGATLVKILDGSDVNFTRDLTKNRNELVFWLDVSPDTNGTLHWSDGSPVSKGWGARIRDNRNKWLDGMHNCTAFRRHDGRLKTFQCAKNLPFICQRGEYELAGGWRFSVYSLPSQKPKLKYFKPVHFGHILAQTSKQRANMNALHRFCWVSSVTAEN